MTREELAAAIRAAAVLEGDFLLRSGRRSKYYVDKYLFETRPELLREVARRLAGFADGQTTRIAGAELGGVALAAAVSLETELPFVIIRNRRKGYGTDKAFEGRLSAGDGVLIVEDIATTGGQVLEAAESLRQSGAKVRAIAAVIDRQEGARENIEAAGFTFHALLDRADLGLPVET